MYKYTFTLQYKGEPKYTVPSNDQLYLSPTGRVFVVYDDDHDEDPDQLHDVTGQYDVTVVTESDGLQAA